MVTETPAPALRCDLNVGTTWLLPDWSTGPRGSDRDVLAAIAAAGYGGVQGADGSLAREAGLVPTTFGIIPEPGSLGSQAALWADLGFECCTLHLGTGYEDDDTARRLVEEVLDASERHGIPLYVETHRATLTQDIWRTVQLVAEFPELRFNGDFSHWYTGLEMTYGDVDAKLEFLAPVFERTRFLHGRIGSTGCIQTDLGSDADPDLHPSVPTFREMWTRSMEGFLRSAAPGDVFVFAPELLPAEIGYARLVPGPDGEPREEGDRWEQALLLCRLARECFAAAVDRVAPAS